MSIYVKLARVFADSRELHRFWMSMARHEAAHVGALELLGVMIDEAEITPRIREIGEVAHAATETIEALHREAEQESVTLVRAFEIAVELESAEVEDLVFELFAMLADPEQRGQAEQLLVHDLSDLSLMIEKYTHDDALLARADALVERHVGRRDERVLRGHGG